jgi:hypothetical protein
MILSAICSAFLFCRLSIASGQNRVTYVCLFFKIKFLSVCTTGNGLYRVVYTTRPHIQAPFTYGIQQYSETVCWRVGRWRVRGRPAASSSPYSGLSRRSVISACACDEAIFAFLNSVVHEGHAHSLLRDRSSPACITSFVYYNRRISPYTAPVSGTVNVWKGNRITPSMANEDAQEVNQRRQYTCSSKSFPTGRERSPGIHL